MNWPCTGDPADYMSVPLLPLGNVDTLPAKASPLVFCASARSIMVACPLSDVVVQLEVSLHRALPALSLAMPANLMPCAASQINGECLEALTAFSYKGSIP